VPDDASLEALRDVFRHHAWATLELIDYCDQLTPEQRAETVPGTRGGILDTLRHIVRADYGYKRRFGVHSKPELQETDLRTLEVMRRVFAEEAELWQSLLGRLADFDITIEAEPWEDPPWPEAPHAQSLLLIQAIHHGNEHRAQICTILGSKGLDVPGLGAWDYWLAERIAR
jgi:uncharacterized damage-inducible protein DinB